MHAMCAWTSSLHFSVASAESWRRKQSSRADLVSGHAQHLRTISVHNLAQTKDRAYGFRPLGFKGFCFGSVESNGFAAGSGAGFAPPHHDES